MAAGRGDRTAGNARPSAVAQVLNGEGCSQILLVCEHASNYIPPAFEGLGLGEAERLSHIAWDPGALPVALAMSEWLDAALVVQRVSRLVYDCNRPPEAESAVREVSEATRIPGNAALSAEARQARVERFYEPFRTTLAGCLDQRRAVGRPTAMVTVHSFTPVFHGKPREVEIGILHDSDARLADALLAILESEGGSVVRRNEPYGPGDGVTHTLLEHAIPRGLANVMLEIRNDLIDSPARQAAMAERLSERVVGALALLEPESGHADGGRRIA